MKEEWKAGRKEGSGKERRHERTRGGLLRHSSDTRSFVQKLSNNMKGGRKGGRKEGRKERRDKEWKERRRGERNEGIRVPGWKEIRKEWRYEGTK